MEIEALSTYAKGDRFEEQVFEFLSREINEGRFYAFRPECCKIYRKKGYYSRDREDFIIFDISVEVFLPGFETPSLLVLIECKNYSGKVPVGDIEDVWFKDTSSGRLKCQEYFCVHQCVSVRHVQHC